MGAMPLGGGGGCQSHLVGRGLGRCVWSEIDVNAQL